MVNYIKKTRDDYNKIAKLFSATRHQAGELEKFKPLIHDGQRILDWGCGNGKLLHIVENHTVDYYGVDQSLEMIKCARHEQRKYFTNKKIHFFCTAEKDKKFKDNFFDLIFMAASLHHLPRVADRIALLKKSFQELKLGGKLIITVWNLKSSWAREKFKKDWKLLGNNDYLVPWKNQEGMILVDRYYHHFTKTELSRLLKSVGFKIEELYYSKGNDQVLQKDARNLVVIAQKK